MQNFIITETVVEKRIVKAESAEQALELWMTHGSDHDAVNDEVEIAVLDRQVSAAE